VTTEGAAAATLSSILFRTVPGKLGRIDPAAVAAAIRADDAQRSLARLVVIENTHVRSGGTVVPLPEMQAVQRVAVEHGVPVHLDGSRLFNAAAYLGVAGAALAATADSVAVNLNKGLGAPLGAVLAGSADFIKEAVRVRNLFGGSWRPANIPAAAGLVALNTMIDRIGEDHVTARRIADGLATLDGVGIDSEQVQTNIVLVRVTRPGLAAERLVEALGRHGLRTRIFMPGVLRLVTYHQIGAAEADRVVEAFRRALAEPASQEASAA
jgi:threonine aldolase